MPLEDHASCKRRQKYNEKQWSLSFFEKYKFLYK